MNINFSPNYTIDMLTIKSPAKIFLGISTYEE